MKQRHKHADVIIAWAEGKDVQVKHPQGGGWCALESSTPHFYANGEYRIKPATKKYRVALFISCGDDGETYTATANTHESADIYATSKRFIRWLTGWIEYEE